MARTRARRRERRLLSARKAPAGRGLPRRVARLPPDVAGAACRAARVLDNGLAPASGASRGATGWRLPSRPPSRALRPAGLRGGGPALGPQGTHAPASRSGRVGGDASRAWDELPSRARTDRPKAGSALQGGGGGARPGRHRNDHRGRTAPPPPPPPPPPGPGRRGGGGGGSYLAAPDRRPGGDRRSPGSRARSGCRGGSRGNRENAGLPLRAPRRRPGQPGEEEER